MCLILLMVAPACFANSSFSSSAVKRIVLHDYGSIRIYLDGDVNTNEDCSSKATLNL